MPVVGTQMTSPAAPYTSICRAKLSFPLAGSRLKLLDMEPIANLRRDHPVAAPPTHVVTRSYYSATRESPHRFYGSDLCLVDGCSPESSTCDRCGSEEVARLYRGLYQGVLGPGGTWNGRIQVAPAQFWEAAARGDESDVVLLNAMGDTFHPSAPDELLLLQFRLMHLVRWKTWIVRPSARGEWPSSCHVSACVTGRCTSSPHRWGEATRSNSKCMGGVRASTQSEADRFLPSLLEVKATVRMVCLHPLLEGIDLSQLTSGLDWVVASGERIKYANYKRVNVEWLRYIRDLCAQRSIPFYFAQHSSQRFTQADPLLDGKLWREFPRRELLPAPSPDERKEIVRWIKAQTIPNNIERAPEVSQ